MPSLKQKRPREEALPVAEAIIEHLTPACTRIEIAGSLRRQKPMVGDIELVCIPASMPNLFGEPEPDMRSLWLRCRELAGGSLDRDGPHYKCFSFRNLQVDLFITDPLRWALIYLMRTGSADFTRLMFTKITWGGYKPDDLSIVEGSVWRGEEDLTAAGLLREETDVFQMWGKAFVDPINRS